MRIILFLATAHVCKCIAQIIANLRSLNHHLSLFEEQRTTKPHRARFLVLVPMFEEQEAAEVCVSRFFERLGGAAGVTVAFTTHVSDQNTCQAVRSVLSQLPHVRNLVHLENNSKSTLKADQLNYALDWFASELTDDHFISVYDVDSIPDSRAFQYIVDYLEINDLDGAPLIAFQQSPFYPLKRQRSFLPNVAISRNIHSLNYHYTAELTAYRKSETRNPWRMSIHLTGHGEHISLRALRAAGGFRPPSCDSSLGFALSYLDVPIIPIPIPDVASSPIRLSVVYRQGMRWYNGCDLYIREFGKAPYHLRNLVLAALTFLNNLRWGLLGPSCVIASIVVVRQGKSASAKVLAPSALLLALFTRHVLLYEAYRQLWRFAGSTRCYTPLSLLQWTCLFPAYLILRLAWSLPPWHYYALRLFGRSVKLGSTPKSLVDSPA